MHENERAAKQAALSKALSTAYLSHQISELENRVQGMNMATATTSTTPTGIAQPGDQSTSSKINGKIKFKGNTDRSLKDNAFPELGSATGERGNGNGQWPNRVGENNRVLSYAAISGSGNSHGPKGRKKIWDEDSIEIPNAQDNQDQNLGVIGEGREREREVAKIEGPGGDADHPAVRSPRAGVGRLDDSEDEPVGYAKLINPQSARRDQRDHSQLRNAQGDLIDKVERAENKSQDGASSASSDEDNEPEWRLVVLDVSGLMWAPRSVRRLLRRGWEVIVPMEAIRTLDILKKGSSPTALAARHAARFIEHSSRQHRPFSADPSLLVQNLTNYKRGKGLRIQSASEHSPISTLTDLPIPTEDIPKWEINVLECAAYFNRVIEIQTLGEMERDKDGDGGRERESSGIKPAVLFVANPPLRLEAEDFTVHGEKGGLGIREVGGKEMLYHERGEGYLLSQEAERFEVGLEVLRDEELEDEGLEHEKWGGGRGRRGRGHGHGHGHGRGEGYGHGHGHGRGGRNGRGKARDSGEKKAPPAPAEEVKILLRRPPTEASNGAISPQTTAGKLDSSPNTTERSPLPAPPEIKASPLLSKPVINASKPLHQIPSPKAQKGRLWDDKSSVSSFSSGESRHHGHGHHHRRRGEREHGRGRGGRFGRGGHGHRDRGEDDRDNHHHDHYDGGERTFPERGRGGFVLLQRPVRPPAPPEMEHTVPRPPMPVPPMPRPPSGNSGNSGPGLGAGPHGPPRPPRPPFHPFGHPGHPGGIPPRPPMPPIHPSRPPFEFDRPGHNHPLPPRPPFGGGPGPGPHWRGPGGWRGPPGPPGPGSGMGRPPFPPPPFEAPGTQDRPKIVLLQRPK